MSQLTDTIRKMFGEGDAKRDEGLSTPDTIERFDNIKYGTEDYWQMLDVYRPKDAKGKKLPVIVSVHGGGWVYGDKEGYQWYTMNLATRGFAVVNFTYRLAPEFKFPSSLEDTNSVFHWIFDNAEEYGFDTDNIFAVGDSAGGHNIALYSCICTNPDYAKNFDFKVPENFVPKAIGLNCGAYIINFDSKEEKDQQDIALMHELIADDKFEEYKPLVEVLDFITEKFPPTFFVTCPGDFLKEHAPLLERKFLDKNVPFTFRYYVSEKEQLFHVFMLNIKSDSATLCNDEETNFFKRFI